MENKNKQQPQLDSGFDFSDDSDEKPFDINVENVENNMKSSVSLSQRNN